MYGQFRRASGEHQAYLTGDKHHALAPTKDCTKLAILVAKKAIKLLTGKKSRK
jgi:hypothetical protein